MEEETVRARKRKIRLIAGLFIVVLIVLTLAGNTLQSLTLPKVVTAQLTKGQLYHDFNGSATVTPREERELTNPAGWKVAKVLVEEGDTVHKGQTLVEYDGSDAKQQITDQELSLQKFTLSMKQMELAIMQALQADDVAAKINATTAYETAKLDKANMQQQIQILKNKFAENQRIVAPFDGVITAVGAVEGLNSAAGPDIKISNAAKGYQSELIIPSDIASMMVVGETLESINVIGDSKDVSGTVEKIEAAPDAPTGSAVISTDNSSGTDSGSAPDTMYRLVVALEGSELQSGDRVKVTINKEDPNQQILVPSKAVHKDMDTAYVYVLDERQSPLGNSYYVRRLPINISNTSGDTTAVSEGLDEFQEVVVDSSGLIMDGTRVHK